MLRYLSCQPIVSVDIYLYHKGKPCLNPDMHEPRIPVNIVEAETQTSRIGIDKARLVVAISKFETPALFRDSEYANQSFCYFVFFRNFPGTFFFAYRTIQIYVWTLCLVCNAYPVLLYDFRLLLYKCFEILKQEILSVHERLYRIGKSQRKVPFKENPVKTGYCAVDFVCLLFLTVFSLQSIHLNSCSDRYL